MQEPTYKKGDENRQGEESRHPALRFPGSYLFATIVWFWLVLLVGG